MPLEPNEQTPPRVTILTPFHGGLNSDLPHALRPPDHALLADYCVIRNGVVEKAGGGLAWGDVLGGAAGTFYWFGQLQSMAAGAISRQELCIHEEVFYELVAGTWTNRGAITGSRYACSAQYGNRLIIVNGSDVPKVWDGTALTDFIGDMPTNIVHLGWTSPGYLVPSTPGNIHHYTASAAYFDAITGDTTQASGPITSPGTGALDEVREIRVKGTAGVPLRFNQIKIYRNKLDLTTRYYEKTFTGPFNPTVDQDVDTGSVPDDQLGAEEPWDADPMPAAQVVVSWDDMLWAIGDPDNPTQIRRSKADGSIWSWPLDNGIECDRLDGFPLTAMHELGGRLYVFKKGKIFLVSRDPTASAAIGEAAYGTKSLPTVYGALCHWGVGQTDDALWTLGEGSFSRFDGSLSTDVARNRFSEELNTYTGVSNDAPIHVAVDRNANRGEMVIGDKFLFRSDTLAFTKADYELSCVTSLERSNGRTWLVADGGDGQAVELMEDSSKAPIVTWIGVYQQQKYRTAFIDPDPNIPHKMFLSVQFLIRIANAANPAGTLTFRSYYDEDASNAGATADLDAWGGATNDAKIVSHGLDGKHARCISIQLESKSDSKKAFRLEAIRIYWKPAGDLYAV
ncbi:MAG: hypothetical protein JRE40_11030 [Deltaproteobacteria bacterium]|nr:hypothetical protein [Deltaproteobacteria bacterium]